MAKVKITYPSFQQPRRVTFGTGSIRALADCTDLDKTALFVDSEQAVWDVLAKCFSKRGLDIDRLHTMAKPPGEPTCETIRLGAALLKETSYRRVVGIGGGSVMDWCRLAWAESQDLLSHGEGRIETPRAGNDRPELWLVPTTCGTGAEATNVAVYSENGRKIPVVSDLFIADQVILDGQFLNHVGPGLLARLLSDALSHAIESFVSIVPGYLAKEAGASALWLILEQYGGEPNSSRNDHLMEAGYLGGVAASHCSVGVIHAFAHCVACHGIPHALGNALGLIAGIRTNADVPAMGRLLGRCGAADAQELVQRIRPIVAAAVAGSGHADLLNVLRGSSSRAALCRRMSEDVCMRSNPKPLADNELNAFLDAVIETAELHSCINHVAEFAEIP